MHRLAAQNSLLEGTFRQTYNGSDKNVTDVGPPLNDLARSVLPWNVARSYGCFDRSELFAVCNRWLGLWRSQVRHDDRSIRNQYEHSSSTHPDIGGVFRNSCWIR